MKSLDEAIRTGKKRYSETPRAFLDEESSIRFAIAEYIWMEAQEMKDKGIINGRNVVDLLMKITK